MLCTLATALTFAGAALLLPKLCLITIMLHRSWWQWTQSADASDRVALQRLEKRLSMEEIAHFRAFVAARSSKVLNKSELHLQHAVDAVDAVVANLGMPETKPFGSTAL